MPVSSSEALVQLLTQPEGVLRVQQRTELVRSRAAKVIGIDVSAKALGLARRRLELHDIDPRRIQLIQRWTR